VNVFYVVVTLIASAFLFAVVRAFVAKRPQRKRIHRDIIIRGSITPDQIGSSLAILFIFLPLSILYLHSTTGKISAGFLGGTASFTLEDIRGTGLKGDELSYFLHHVEVGPVSAYQHERVFQKKADSYLPRNDTVSRSLVTLGLDPMNFWQLTSDIALVDLPSSKYCDFSTAVGCTSQRGCIVEKEFDELSGRCKAVIPEYWPPNYQIPSTIPGTWYNGELLPTVEEFYSSLSRLYNDSFTMIFFAFSLLVVFAAIFLFGQAAMVLIDFRYADSWEKIVQSCKGSYQNREALEELLEKDLSDSRNRRDYRIEVQVGHRVILTSNFLIVLSRFKNGDIDVFPVDLTDISTIPTVFSFSYSTGGPKNRTYKTGQSATILISKGDSETKSFTFQAETSEILEEFIYTLFLRAGLARHRLLHSPSDDSLRQNRADLSAKDQSSIKATTRDGECVLCETSVATVRLGPCAHVPYCQQCFTQAMRDLNDLQRSGSASAKPLRCPLCNAEVTDVNL